MNISKENKRYKSKFFFLILILIILYGVMTNPQLSIKSANSGLGIWFNTIIPSLLPFFIISELLIGFGFIDLIGKILQPLMKPIFNTSGEGAFPFIMSLLSGYPMGAKLTSRLREEKLINKLEADRLICFSSTSGPLFMLGAVCIGMLNDISLAPLILIPHYLSAFLIGILFSFYKKNHKLDSRGNNNSFINEFKKTYNSWIYEKKSIGSLITKATKESMDTILLIGGLVIFYSVFVEILFNFDFINKLINLVSNFLYIDISIVKSILMGFFEMTIGCKSVSTLDVSPIIKILIINFIIGFGGLSVHSQALSFTSKTDISSKLFVIAKIIHGFLSTSICYIIYIFGYKNIITSTFNKEFIYDSFNLSNWINLLTSSTKLAITMVFYIIFISLVSSIILGNKNKFN